MAHRRSLLSFSSLSVQELIAQHKACDAATKKGPYTYTKATHAARPRFCWISCYDQNSPPPHPNTPTTAIFTNEPVHVCRYPPIMPLCCHCRARHCRCRGARWCAALRRYLGQCRTRFEPNVLRCSATRASACNSAKFISSTRGAAMHVVWFEPPMDCASLYEPCGERIISGRMTGSPCLQLACMMSVSVLQADASCPVSADMRLRLHWP